MRAQEKLVAACEAGERITKADAGCSIHEREDASLCPDGVHAHWRTIVCVPDERDVVECSRCGQQRTTTCNFNDDFS